MNQNHNDVRATAQTLLNRGLGMGGESLTPLDIRNAVERTIVLFGCDDVEVDQVVAELESSFQTIIGAVRSLVLADRRTAGVNQISHGELLLDRFAVIRLLSSSLALFES